MNINMTSCIILSAGVGDLLKLILVPSRGKTGYLHLMFILIQVKSAVAFLYSS